MDGMTDQEKSGAAFMHHAKQVRFQYEQAKENVEWLTGPEPTWVDGSKLSPSDVETLLKNNQSRIEYIEKFCQNSLRATEGMNIDEKEIE